MRHLFLLSIALLALGAEAKTATLQGATTNTCTFSETKVGDGGDLTVTCVVPPAPPVVQPPPAPPAAPPAATCPAFSGRVRDLGTAGEAFGNDVQGPPGSVSVFNLPTAAQGNTGSGVLGLYPRPFTMKAGPAITEVKVSKCKGDFTPSADGCYQANAALDGGQIDQFWAKQYTARYADAASFVSHHRCLIDSGVWFINVRLKTYPADTACGNACGWVATWHQAG
jgi:hypothetical protein